MAVNRSAAEILADMRATSIAVDEPPEPEFMTTGQVADLFGMGPETVRRWVTAGALTPAYRTGGGHRRFLTSEVMALRDLLDVTNGVPSRGQVAWVVETVAAAAGTQTSASATTALTRTPSREFVAAVAAVPGGSEGDGRAGASVGSFRTSPPTSHPAIGGRGEGRGNV